MKAIVNKEYKLNIIKDLGMIFPTENSKNKSRYVLARCYCGAISRFQLSMVNHSKHCNLCKNNSKIKHGKSNTTLFNRWSCMLNRCYNKNASDYSRYGWTGVKVCAEWKDDFYTFHDWALANWFNEQLTIDKDILSDKFNIYPPIYSPKTCQWISILENKKFRTKFKSSLNFCAIGDMSLISKAQLLTGFVTKPIFNRYVPYNKDGSFNSAYDSIDLSGKTTSNKSNINRATNVKYMTAVGGLYWRAIKSTDNIMSHIDIVESPRLKRYNMLSLDGIYIKTCITAKEALKITGLKSISSVDSICNGYILPSGNKRISAKGFMCEYA